MPISTYPSFVGLKKEVTPGTPVVVDTFIPATDIASEDVRNYAADTAMRGSAVDSYGQFPTQGWGTFNFGGPVYMDTIGHLLLGIFGSEDLSGAGPYVHTFGLKNAGTFQPPTYTLVDYNGYEARSFPYGVFSQLEFSYSPDGLLTKTAQAQTFASTAVTKPTQSFSANTAVAAYKTVVTIGGSATLLMESATITLTRQTNPLTAVNNSTSPSNIWAGSLAATGSMTFVYNDDTYLTPMLNGTSQVIDLVTTNGADSLELRLNSGLSTAAPITRGNNGWMEITVALTGVGNTTDASTAGTGYSPARAVLTNTRSTAY